MARATRKTQAVNLDFAFFTQLWNYYNANRGYIRTHYKSLTKKFLDFNNPANGNAFLRQPQFEALEIYVFFKEFLNNAQVHQAFRDWADNTGKFEGRSVSDRAGQTQLDIMQEASKEQYDALYRQMKSSARAYSNYIFALTMGTGKTILMATCIFYEFILANKFPKDERFCHNVLVFAPDKTVLQSLREIQTFEMRKVVPPEYVNFLDANIKFHFLDESGASLNTIDKSRFNIIISNTQKIILKRQNTEKTQTDLLFGSGKQTYERGNVYDQFADLYGFDEPDDEVSLSTNQRFEKLRRLEQLGIYIDEAHHAFGDNLAKDVGAKKDTRKTSLRNTVDELAISLRQTGTRVVACYNYTGTPYVKQIVLPEVVYAFGLQEAIQKEYLKKVTVNGYSNPKTGEFVEIVIDDFIEQMQGQRHEGMLPKLAFFAATIKELQEELRPAVESALIKHDIPISSILVNVGDDKLTSNDDIREFNRLDTPQSEKQFILLVNKGREGWNCRSLFGVALFRQPKSKIFVLQATMRCLRAIGDGQQTGYVHLSDDNKDILDAELQQNFRVSLQDIENTGKTRERITAHVVEPIPKYKLKRIRRQFNLKEKNLVNGIDLKLENAMKCENTDKYRLIRTQQEGLSVTEAMKHKRTTEDLTDRRQKREFSEITLVAEIARYLNKSCLFVRDILAQTEEGTDSVLEAINEFNELLYDWVIPHLFKELYDIEEDTTAEEYEVELVKLSPEGYTLSANKDLIVSQADAGDHADKSFHLDKYAFDSNPEKTLFWNLLQSGRVKKLYFTGMLTHGQTEFFIQYVDPDSHTIRSYYPDFVVEKEDKSLVIVEVKGDNKIDDPLVRAKQEAAEQFAYENDMTYRIIKGSEADQGVYQSLLE
ncbi:TnsA endonuclease N-terminal domain-containing protein [Nodosilinea sp. P-1105]|uniref:TnsA endonuclease N-terminal domain-containing protein n=1 Tax=Nodosilinea sp. P-1105 TaxID=2546229 RepID=UPI00146A402C|nr:TnsA endonuclease N-terminal domain-containing protein [Nodosilinea sp. P-1105]NMF86298.1 type III restriction endonuclease [Nodosilinea sp. P-1105]